MGFGTMRSLTGDFIKNFRENIGNVFNFSSGFVVTNWGKSGFRVFCVSLEVFFVKLMNF